MLRIQVNTYSLTKKTLCITLSNTPVEADRIFPSTALTNLHTFVFAIAHVPRKGLAKPPFDFVHIVTTPIANFVHCVPTPIANFVHIVPTPIANFVHKIPTPIANFVHVVLDESESPTVGRCKGHISIIKSP